jgi:hypothetical protein
MGYLGRDINWAFIHSYFISQFAKPYFKDPMHQFSVMFKNKKGVGSVSLISLCYSEFYFLGDFCLNFHYNIAKIVN